MGASWEVYQGVHVVTATNLSAHDQSDATLSSIVSTPFVYVALGTPTGVCLLSNGGPIVGNVGPQTQRAREGQAQLQAVGFVIRCLKSPGFATCSHVCVERHAHRLRE